MDLGADTEGTHHGPGFGSITEEGSGMRTGRERLEEQALLQVEDS